MILVVNSIKDLDFSKTVELYSADLENARSRNYRYMDPYEGRRLAENDLYYYLKDVFFYESHGVYFIYLEQNQYVSAVRLEPYAGGQLLNSLITAENFRKNGYAAALLSKITESVVGPIYSHIHRKNLSSIKLHQKFGFQKLYDHAVLLDGTVSTDHITYIRNG